MPFRHRRAARVPSTLRTSPSFETTMEDTPRNRAARAVYDAAQWLDTYDVQAFRERVAVYGGLVAGLVGTLQMHKEAHLRGVARGEDVIGSGMFDSPDIFAGEVIAAARPIALAIGGCFATGWAVPVALKAVVIGARCVAWGLREQKKEPPLSQHAQRLKQLHGSRPLSPTPSDLPHGDNAARKAPPPQSSAVCGGAQSDKTHPRSAPKRARRAQRKTPTTTPHDQPRQPAGPLFSIPESDRLVAPFLPSGSDTSLESTESDRLAAPFLSSGSDASLESTESDRLATPFLSSGSDASLESSMSSESGPLSDAGSLSKFVLSPRSVLPPQAIAPSSVSSSDSTSAPARARPQRTALWEKQASRARRRDKAAARAAMPPRPRGPFVTGLSYDNRVVVEQGPALFWQSRDAYPQARLESMRPAPYKTVPRAHRHAPSPALRAALRRALRTRQDNGLRAQDIIDVLGRHGYHTYLVGGAVRDLLRDPQHPIPDVDLVTDAPTSEVLRLVRAALDSELPKLQVTSSDVAHYQGVVSYDCIDVASIRVRGMFEPKRLNHTTYCRVYPLSFGTCLRADAKNRDLTCNAIYYDPAHDLLLDPTGHGIADACNKHLRAPSATFAMMNTTWALRYLKFLLRGYTPADAATTQLMIANARACFATPRFASALERVREGSLEAWCRAAAHALEAAGCDDLVQHIQLAVPTLEMPSRSQAKA